MKRILLLALALLCALNVHAQEGLDNLRIVGEEVIWQKIFTDSLSVSDIIWKLELSGKFKDIVVDHKHGCICCSKKPERINYSKLGISSLDVQIFLNDDCSYQAIIQVKDGMYRVTVRDVIFESHYKSTYQRSSLSSLAIKKNEFVRSFMYGESPMILDTAFTEAFSFAQNAESYLSDEW